MLKFLLFTVIIFFIGLMVFNGGKLSLLTARVSHSDIPSQIGKVMVVTGANSGIGYESCKEFIKVGGTCIATARTIQKAEETAKRLNALNFSGKVIGMELELSDHKSIYSFAKSFREKNLPLHILMLNAGMMALPEYEETKDGLEMQMGVNFIGHYYLNTLLQDLLEKQPSRVIILTSAGHQMVINGLPSYSVIKGSDIKSNYWGWWQYGASKLANIYHAQELDERMKKEKKDVIVVAVHPGAVATELGRYAISSESILRQFWRYTLLTPSDGAVTQMYAATTLDKPKERLSGKYMEPQAKVVATSSYGVDVKLRKQLIKEADEIVSRWPKL